MYAFLDKFFFVFHTSIVLFLLSGWAWKKTRPAHLVLVLLIAFSWFVLGIWYGFGYCPSTDWHWRVRERLGYVDMPSSYLQFLFQKITGWGVERKAVDLVALGCLAAAFILSVALNRGGWKRMRFPFRR